MKKFRYDYNRKMLIANIMVALLFLLISIPSYNKGIAIFCVAIFGLLVSSFNAFVLIFNQGITINDKKVIIIDYFWFTKIELDDIRWAEVKELKKEKKSNLYGFFHEFYDSSTYMFNSDYIYNNGKVFSIIFHLKDGTTRDTYFGWMYREKNAKKVDKITKKLENFINQLNATLRDRRKIKNIKNHI